MAAPIPFAPSAVTAAELDALTARWGPLPPEHDAWLRTWGHGTLSGWLVLHRPSAALDAHARLDERLARHGPWDAQGLTEAEARDGLVLLETVDGDAVLWCPRAARPGYHRLPGAGGPPEWLGEDLEAVLTALAAATPRPSLRVLEPDGRGRARVDAGGRFDEVDAALRAALSPAPVEVVEGGHGPAALHVLNDHRAWLHLAATPDGVRVDVFADPATLPGLVAQVAATTGGAPEEQATWTGHHQGPGPRVLAVRATLTRPAAGPATLDVVVDALHGDAPGAVIEVQVLALDGHGRPFARPVLTARDLHPHERRRLEGRWSGALPAGTSLAAVRPTLLVGRAVVRPVIVDVGWTPPDAAGARGATLFVELDHPGPPADRARLRVVWGHPGAGTVGQDELPGEPVRVGRQVLAFCAARIPPAWPLTAAAWLELVTFQGVDPDPAGLPVTPVAPAVTPAAPGRPAPAPAPPPGAPGSPAWALLDAGDVDGALAAFAEGLTVDDRQRANRLLGSRDPEEQALGLRIALAGRWTHAAHGVRALLRSPDPAVRLAACELLGELGPPSLAPALRGLTDDPDDKVAAAATAAYAAMRTR